MQIDSKTKNTKTQKSAKDKLNAAKKWPLKGNGK